MSDIDWKSLKPNTVETIRSVPWQYIQALVQFNLWDKFTEAFYDESLARFAIDALLKPKVRKGLLKNATEERVINLLDTVTPAIRRHLLHILIEQADTVPVSIKVGETVYKNADKHLWAYHNTADILSLLPIETLRIAFRARINPKHNKTQLSFFNYCVDPSNSYDKKDFTKQSFVYLNNSYFAPLRHLAKRKAFGDLLADLIIEGLNGYAKKKRKYFQFVLQPFLQVFFQFEEVWVTNKNVHTRVKEALLKFPFHLTKKFNLNEIFCDNRIANYWLSLHQFVQKGILKQEDILLSIVPKVLKYEFEQPLDKTRFLKQIISSLSTNYANPSVINFYRALKTTSETKKDHPLAFIWPKLISVSEEYYIKEFNDGRSYFLNNLLQSVYTYDHKTTYDMPHRQFVFTYDFVMGLFNKLIRTTIENKANIVKESPEKYSNQMTTIFNALLNNMNWKKDINICLNSLDTPFFYLSAELRDEILTEVMCDPTGKKNLSVDLSKEVSTVALSLSLLFSDLKKLTAAIARNKLDSTDEYGFQDNVSINFPPSLTQATRKTEDYKGKVHVFERFLFPMLRHKNTAIVTKAYQLYNTFVRKLLNMAITLDNANFFKLASEAHFRYCRFLSSKVNSNIQAYVNNEFCNFVVIPTAIYAGIKSHDDYASFLYSNLISKFPFTTDNIKIPMLNILKPLLMSSYCKVLPGIGAACGSLTTKILDRLFSEMPSSFECPNAYNDGTTYGTLGLPPSEAKINSIRTLRNAQGSLLLTEKLTCRILKNIFSEKRKSIEKVSQKITGIFIDPSLLTPELIKSFEPTIVGPASEPFLAVAAVLKEKIAKYNSEFYKQPSTRLIEILISKLKFNGLFDTLNVNRKIPSVPFNYEQMNTENTYAKNISRFNYNFIVCHTTACVAKTLLPEETFLYRLFSDSSLNFDSLDEILVFKPLTKAEEDELKKNPKKKQHIRIKANVNIIPDPSVTLRLVKHDQRPKPKRKPCNKCGHLNPAKEPQPPQKVGHEDWMDIISWDLIQQLLKTDAAAFCNAVKTDGEALFDFVRFLYLNLKNNEKCEESLNLVSSLLDLCFKDILVVDPEPTPQEPNPKPLPTLFVDEEGHITTVLPPFEKKIKKGRRAKAKTNVKTAGQQRYQSTKVLIAYLGSILSYKIARNKSDVSLFSNSLISVLSLPSPDLKKKIGDDNFSYYADHLSAALLNHIAFGADLKSQQWAEKFATPAIECFFRLFSCDSVHHNALEWANQQLLSLSKVDERNAIISSFVSALEKNALNYSLHTRTRTVAWCLDYRYVGFPLPQYCINFVQRLADDVKLHLDIRKTIVAGSVAFFKARALVNAGTEQFEELFPVLKKVYDSSKNNMAPTFCQLVRPKYCLGLAKQSPLYKALMPPDSTPDSYLTPQNFGRLSMPHTGVWKEPHERFVSTFIGASLLSKDENVLQLAIQVLTKLNIRGGETAHKIAPFITTAFKEFNVLIPSAILINFMFKFCLQEPHQSFDGLIDGFVSIFAKTRAAFDTVNEQQMKLFWTHDQNFRDNMYEPLGKICGIFTGCIEDSVANLKEKADFHSTLAIAKRVVAALDGEKTVTAYFEPFDRLRNTFAIVANDDLIAGISTEVGEEALKHLLLFVKSSAITTCLRLQFPQFVHTCFQKNYNSLTIGLVKSLCEWPLDVAQDNKVTNLVRTLFDSLINKIGKENEEFNALIPRIWMFTSLLYSPRPLMDNGITPEMCKCSSMEAPVAHYKETRGRGGGRAPSLMMMKSPAIRRRAQVPVPQSCDAAMMLSNSMMCQNAAPRMFGAMGVNRFDAEFAPEAAMEECCDEMVPECEAGSSDVNSDDDVSDEEAEACGLFALD